MKDATYLGAKHGWCSNDDKGNAFLATLVTNCGHCTSDCPVTNEAHRRQLGHVGCGCTDTGLSAEERRQALKTFNTWDKQNYLPVASLNLAEEQDEPSVVSSRQPEFVRNGVMQSGGDDQMIPPVLNFEGAVMLGKGKLQIDAELDEKEREETMKEVKRRLGLNQEDPDMLTPSSWDWKAISASQQ